MFDFQPVLSTSLVSLRPLEVQDFSALYAVASDPLIWEQHPARDRCQETFFRKFFDDAIESGGAFAILDGKSGRVIGSSRYAAYSAAESEVEIGWTFLSRDFWGGPYNTEVKTLMLDHAFKFVGTVIFGVHVHNMRSRRAVLKLGAHRDSTPSAADESTVVFRLTSADFRRRLAELKQGVEGAL